MEDYDIDLCKGYQGFGPNLVFLLLPLIQGSFFEKRDGKRNTIVTLKFGREKIFFLLPNKLITIYVQLTLVNV